MESITSSPPSTQSAPPPVRRWRTLRSVARLAAALGLVAALAAGIFDDLVAPWLPGVSQTFAAAADAPADQTAIKNTITRADTEQAQALASGDPSLMADMSTPQYLQEMTQVNQDLASGGVASIALVDLEWGPVSVNGSTASATAYETWSTTLTDGTTVQSRDENDYTLVQDDGVWEIATDTHPAATGTGASQPTTAAPAPTTSSPSDPGTSSNWAGYAATNGTYTAVSGTWTVPAYTATGSAGANATWVGIGGVTSQDLIQAGTQEATSGTGQTEYQAWIEMLPQASRTVPLAVSPGDSITVSIAERATNTWLIAFTNNTTGKSYQQTVQYASSNSSAEWIEEAPSASRAGVAPLDNFGTVTFTGGSTVKNGQTESIAAAGATGITMIGSTRQALAVPSGLGSDGASFSVNRTSVPATGQAPAPSQTRISVLGV
jgi:Peptidase A4 family